MHGTRLALVALFATSWAHADILPEPNEGNRFVERSLRMDASALPAGHVLRESGGRRSGGVEPLAHTSAFESPLRFGLGQERIHLFVVPRELAAKDPTIEELGARGITPAVVHAPPMAQVTANDQRWSVERRAQLVSTVPLRVVLVDDAFQAKSGEVVCTRPPLAEGEIEEGLDPCDPDARSKRATVFVRAHRVGIGGATGVFLLGMLAFGVHRLRRKKRK